MSSNKKKETKLQLRLYPEKNLQHRRALEWLMTQRADGASYGDLVSGVICDLLDRQESDNAEEKMRQVVRDEIRSNLHTITVTATPASSAPIAPPKASDESQRKAKGFMSAMGFG